MNKFILASFLMAFLSACGGGGDSGGGTPVDPTLSVSLSSVPAEMNESSTLSITVSATGVKNTISSSVVVTEGADIVSINDSNPNQLSITFSNLTVVDAEFSFMVKVQDGLSDDIKRNWKSPTYKVNVKNSSFEAELNQITFVNDSRDRIINQHEEVNVLSKLQELNNYLNNSKTLGYNINQSSEELEIAFDTLLLQEYLNKKTTEVQLREKFNDLNNLINSYYLPYIQSINSNLELLSNKTGLNILPVEKLTFNEELNSISLFTGNTDLGSIVDGEWVFNSQFTYLTDIINTECSI